MNFQDPEDEKRILKLSKKKNRSYRKEQCSREQTAAAAKLLQPCPTLCNPTDRSPPGSSVPGILQARTLEWAVISFSKGIDKMALKQRHRKRSMVIKIETYSQLLPQLRGGAQSWKGISGILTVQLLVLSLGRKPRSLHHVCIPPQGKGQSARTLDVNSFQVTTWNYWPELSHLSREHCKKGQEM